MSQKKRTNQEIEAFVSGFKSWIAQKLSGIPIVKLSADHIKETEDEIKKVKAQIKETQSSIKIQRKVVLDLSKKKPVPKSAKLMTGTSAPLKPLDGIEVFTIEEEEDQEEQKEEFEL
jgi:hypothetical protein